MKPPPRPRLVPARFAEAPGGRPRAAAWSLREKRSLLAALRAQAALGLPQLQARPLRDRLPRRTEAEILRLVSRLRGRAAREAVGTQHRACLQEQRRLRAPIEVWLELAQTLAEGVEEAAAAAFSQALTIAGTEPRSLRGGGLGVDFGRLYGFLARLARGGDAPELPPGEAAVLLALLASLPPALGALPRAPLQHHLRAAYSTLTAPGGGTVGGAGGGPQGQDPPPGNPPPTWEALGLCPLNLFLVPLRLLAATPGPPPAVGGQ